MAEPCEEAKELVALFVRAFWVALRGGSVGTPRTGGDGAENEMQRKAKMISWPWDQIGILVIGLPALWLTTYRQFRIRRWAYILGLVSEIFWVWTCITHEQWWILGSVAAYTFIWGRGFWEHWVKEQ